MYKLVCFALVLFVISAVNAQNVTCAGDCVACVGLGNACFYCSTTGCKANTAANQLTCTNGDGSPYSTVGQCPDPCTASNNDNPSCTECLSSSCGWCQDRSTCYTGTSTGPRNGISCSWRFQGQLTEQQTCSIFKTCTSIKDCGSCVQTAQDSTTACTWCNSGSCVAASAACPSGDTRFTNFSQCPVQSTNSASGMTAGVVSFFGFMAALGL